MSNWSTKINVRNASANPIVKLLNIVFGIIEFVVGIRKSGLLSEENDCIVVDTKTSIL